MGKEKKTFASTHAYYNYLRTTEYKDLSKAEKRDRQTLYRTLDKLFLKANAGHKYHILTADGRKRLSTMIKPELKKRVQSYAHEEGYSIADVIELALMEYLKERGA